LKAERMRTHGNASGKVSVEGKRSCALRNVPGGGKVSIPQKIPPLTEKKKILKWGGEVFGKKPMSKTVAGKTFLNKKDPKTKTASEQFSRLATEEDRETT